MIDLHIHILPGLDDGAETMEDALEMARISAESGVDTVVASSHGNFDGYEPEELYERYERKFQTFQERLSEEEIPLKVCRGMAGKRQAAALYQRKKASHNKRGRLSPGGVLV